MPPTARVVLATVFVVLIACYSQLIAIRTAREQYQRVVPFSALIAEVRVAATRSPHAEIYAPASRLGFVVAGDLNPGAASTIGYALQYALAPAVVTIDPSAERIVVFFKTPADQTPFEAANRVRLLDTLGETVRVYQRERN